MNERPPEVYPPEAVCFFTCLLEQPGLEPVRRERREPAREFQEHWELPLVQQVLLGKPELGPVPSVPRSFVRSRRR